MSVRLPRRGGMLLARVRVPLAILVMCGVVPCAQAHQYWLTLTDYTPPAGGVVEVHAFSGVGFRGEAKPWNPNRCVDFSWITYRRFTLAAMAPEDDITWAHQSYFDRGGAWVQYQSNFANIELPAAEFDTYLSDEGLAEPRAVRQRMATPVAGRERYRRCAKAWVAGTDARRAAKPVGQPLEIVPLSLPGALPQLRVRLLWQGKPLAGAIVKTWRQPLAADGRTRALADRDSVARVEAVRTDARGEASLGVNEPGEWMLNVVHMVPCADTTAADWESTWASLTFARHERAAAAPR